MNEQDLTKYIPSNTEIAENLDYFAGQLREFQELMMMYNCAIREVRTKLDVLNDEMAVCSPHNPIEMIKSRVKKPRSIVEKLQRRGYPISVDSVLDNLHDVAGVRVICSFIDDIYKIAAILGAQDDVTVLEIKDYIKNPKPNGYRSYHMIVEIPVFFSDRKQPMKVEVQIRTIAMDFWASLEHQMKYKKDVPGSEDLVNRLSQIADRINQTDMEMQEIREEIQSR
ncbi:GTP pyrophosphokinase family protein [Oscillospiraceae bacterium Marseille-Q3528]|nr:GTP pyrophosphokinase family protein [Oscillospiraceae bacterium Marseille-Q3528]WNV57189.1 GTP pyrophosphokinase family protein [Oscillospiraceae bacterium NTUH-002-81]